MTKPVKSETGNARYVPNRYAKPDAKGALLQPGNGETKGALPSALRRGVGDGRVGGVGRASRHENSKWAESGLRARHRAARDRRPVGEAHREGARARPAR